MEAIAGNRESGEQFPYPWGGGLFNNCPGDCYIKAQNLGRQYHAG